MQILNVVIVFSGSLLSACLASRLCDAGFSDVFQVNINEPGALDKIKQHKPDVVLYDASDEAVADGNLALYFLREIPNVRVVEVDSASDKVQIFCSQHEPAHEMTEFVSLMKKIAVSMD